MNLIDDKGRLFGTVNVIDALVVLLVLAVVAAGTTFVLGADDRNPTDQPQTTATLEITGVKPYVADAIPDGSVRTNGIAAVENKSVRPTEVVVADQNGMLHERPHPRKKTVTLRVSLNTTTSDEETRFRDKPVEIGQRLTLDFGHVNTTGNVTGLPDGN